MYSPYREGEKSSRKSPFSLSHESPAPVAVTLIVRSLFNDLSCSRFSRLSDETFPSTEKEGAFFSCSFKTALISDRIDPSAIAIVLERTLSFASSVILDGPMVCPRNSDGSIRAFTVAIKFSIAVPSPLISTNPFMRLASFSFERAWARSRF